MLDRSIKEAPEDPVLIHLEAAFYEEAFTEVLPLESGRILTVEQHYHLAIHSFKVWEAQVEGFRCISHLDFEGKDNENLFSLYLPEGALLAGLKDRIFSYNKEKEFLCRGVLTLKSFGRFKKLLDDPFHVFSNKFCSIGDNKFLVLQSSPYLSSLLTFKLYQHVNAKVKYLRTLSFKTKQPLNMHNIELFGDDTQFGFLNKTQNWLCLWKKTNDGDYQLALDKSILNKNDSMRLHKVLHIQPNEIFLLAESPSEFAITGNVSWIIKVNLTTLTKNYLGLTDVVTAFYPSDQHLTLNLPFIFLKIRDNKFPHRNRTAFALFNYATMTVSQLTLAQAKALRMLPNGDIILINQTENFSGFSIYRYPAFYRSLQHRDHTTYTTIQQSLSKINDLSKIVMDYVNHDVKFCSANYSFFKAKNLVDVKENIYDSKRWCTIL